MNVTASETSVWGGSKRGTVKVVMLMPLIETVKVSKFLCKIRIRWSTYGGKLVQNVRTK